MNSQSTPFASTTTFLGKILSWLCRFFATGFRPLHVGPVEFFILRLVFACLVWETIIKWDTLPFESQPYPSGLAHFMDLTWLNNPANLQIAQFIALLGLLLYVVGRGLVIALPVVTFIQVSINSLYNSQGYHFHGHQLIGLALFAQLVVVLVIAFMAIGKSPAKRTRLWLLLPGLILFYSQMAVAGAYAVSVVSKHKNSNGKWLARSHYHAGQLIKTDRQHYYSTVPENTLPGDSDSARKAHLIANNPTLARIMFGIGFFTELFVFLGLRNRRWALAIGFAILALHYSIYVIMRLQFPLNEYLCILIFINPYYWMRRFLPGGEKYSRFQPPVTEFGLRRETELQTNSLPT